MSEEPVDQDASWAPSAGGSLGTSTGRRAWGRLRASDWGIPQKELENVAGERD